MKVMAIPTQKCCTLQNVHWTTCSKPDLLNQTNLSNILNVFKYKLYVNQAWKWCNELLF